ncbi:MAG: TIGR00159 family protein, partial [Deltaproteobacteria bacterium]|nr:TIGR00159 family protein [Deltaproteobacteria bacterium]
MSFLVEYFGNVRSLELAVAVLDIALVYYVVYRALLLIKGTRAVQMLIGLLLIILAFF